MTQKNVFLSICGFLSISHIKGCRNQIISKDVEKLRNCCYNLCVHSPFHIDVQVLTSNFHKIVELRCFGCDSILSQRQIFFIVAHCNIIRTYQRGKKERKLCRQKKWAANFFGITPTPCVVFHNFFFVNFPPPSLMRYMLNCPLEAHLEPCQTPVKQGYQARKHVRYLRTASI